MDLISMETTGQARGNAFVWRAKTLLCLMLNQSNRQAEAISILDDVLAKQKEYFGMKYHPSFEYTLGQIANASAKTNNYEKAEEAYTELIELRKETFGKHYDGILPSLITLVSLLGALNKQEEVVVRCK